VKSSIFIEYICHMVLVMAQQVLESVHDLGDRSDNQYVDDLFDEVENLSDSDIDMDTMSVHSTPKPKLT
jgi:hypothetical protein